MKRFSEQFYKEAQSVKLQTAEKRELRERLVSYMEYHPLPAELKTKKASTAERIKTEAFATVSIPFSMLFKGAAAVAVMVLVVVPFMAEKAVPGDTLYAVKVQFNEELRSTLTFDSYEKVEWETERLNRRIAEARLLASEGRLTEEVEAEVAAAVKEHTESAQKEIEVLRQTDVDDATIASIALDTTLEVQSKAFRKDQEVAASSTTPVVSLIASALDASRVGELAETPATPSYAKLIARMEQNTTRIYELSDSLSTVAPQEKLKDVDRRIADLERTISEAIALVENDEASARLSLVEALQRSQRLIVYMTEIEVQSTVDIESLVPVVLTPEEKSAFIASTTADIKAKTFTLERALLTLEDADIASKIENGLLEVEEANEVLSATTTDFATYKTTAEDVVALLNDLISLLEIDEVPLPEPEPIASTTITGPDTVEENGTSTEGVVPEDVTATTTGTTSDVVIDNQN